MGTIRKKVTPAVLAANQANSAASTGPASGSGKEQSKKNAVKSGKYAQRPDPVELLLNDHTEEEETEREQLRAASVRSYQPPDEFARVQAEELGDLRFELRRVERAKEVMLARERELLALEQRKRALRLKVGVEKVHMNQIYRSGVASQEDSPGKFREMLEVLELLVRYRYAANDVHLFLDRLYGDSWRGARLNRALTRAESTESDEDRERAQRDFKLEVEREIAHVREEIEICEQEQGPLSKAGEAARLVEVMGSRKWSWIRQHETFLRRSIDRKVQVLIELRREALLAERLATEVADSASRPGRKPDGGASGGNRGRPADGDPVSGDGPVAAPNPESQTPNPEEAGARNDKLDAGRDGRQLVPGGGALKVTNDSARGVEKGNQGTKPLSPLVSAEPWGELEPWVIDSRDLPQALAAVEPLDWTLETPWSPVSRS
ncbi:MAG TPA: hypothetical protein VMT20_01155 [Terriglobia bacterium]|nr:hypothetical protein [Terriglobia bacterium]